MLVRSKRAAPLSWLLGGTRRRAGTLGQPALPLAQPLLAVWGANTGVGKTLVSAGLAAAARRANVPLLYLKPIQTGFPLDSDGRLVAAASGAAHTLGPHAAALASDAAGARQASGSDVCKTLYAWHDAVSPHLAVEAEGRLVSDSEVNSTLAAEASAFLHQHRQWPRCLGLVETAGGVASPGPSGTLQCDLLRPLRLPALLVGDGRLGGISSTLAAHEMLTSRGYEVPLVALADGPPGGAGLGNAAALARHLASRSAVVSLPACRPPGGSDRGDAGSARLPALDAELVAWLEESSAQFDGLLERVFEFHARRLSRLQAAAVEARSVLWWPFTQHGAVAAGGVSVLDARAGESLAVYCPEGEAGSTNMLVSQYDACASWWTQGVGQAAQPALARALSAAAGRYGHVIFPENVHEPALELAKALLASVGADWASRVFYSDDGSTAVEVALKMAFRKFAAGSAGRAGGSAPQQQQQRREQQGGGRPAGPGWEQAVARYRQQYLLLDPAADLQRHHQEQQYQQQYHVLGLAGGYHGDTLGAMDAVAPSPYTGPAQTPWCRPRGLFLEPPTLQLTRGQLALRLPADLAAELGGAASLEPPLASLEAALSGARDGSPLAAAYRRHVAKALRLHRDALPGAAVAACIVEPLLQGAGGMRLVDPLFQRQLVSVARAEGIPVIFDEVFTGLWRLGAPSAAALLGEAPDIGVYAKLLTGGTVPLAATLASEDVFRAFQGPSKLQALLHGHSYSAHPIGCAAGEAALQLYSNPTTNPNLCVPSSPGVEGRCTRGCATPCGRLLGLWPEEGVQRLSHHPSVQGVVALGTVLAAELATETKGYVSDGAAGVTRRLRSHGVYARPLGNVVYLMVTPMTDSGTCRQLLAALEACLEG